MEEKGAVKWFNGEKGHGFIQRSSGGDVFANGFKSLNEGDRIEFEVTQGSKGLQAQNVVKF